MVHVVALGLCGVVRGLHDVLMKVVHGIRCVARDNLVGPALVKFVHVCGVALGLRGVVVVYDMF
jgi:hypothetical protein